VKLWDVSGECLQTLQGHRYGQSRSVLKVRPISGGNDQTVKLWMSAPVSLRTLQGHTSVRSVVFDVQTPASGSDDETIKLWDIKTGECLKTQK